MGVQAYYSEIIYALGDYYKHLLTYTLNSTPGHQLANLMMTESYTMCRGYWNAAIATVASNTK
jgi:hypothetical protein